VDSENKESEEEESDEPPPPPATTNISKYVKIEASAEFGT
jgi:hypothetical protein